MRFSSLLILLSSLYLGSALAAPVLELPGEVLLSQAVELRAQLNLNATQLGAWLQAESRTRPMLQERRARRERLQMEVEAALVNDKGNMADLAHRIDEEESQSLEENRGLRQQWLHLFEGLDAGQRRILADALHKPLPAQSAPASNVPRQSDDSPRREGRGGKAGRGGGLGGLGGSASGF